MCDCIAQTNEELAKHPTGSNTILAFTVAFERQTGKWIHLVSLAVDKRDLQKRQRPIRVLPTCCPFCGEKYPLEVPDND